MTPASSTQGVLPRMPTRLPQLMGRFTQHAVLIAASIGALFPIWFMINSAFRDESDYFRAPLGLPHSLLLDNFTRVLGERVGHWIINSLITTVGSGLLVIIVAAPAAYCFARLPFKGSGLLLRLIIYLMAIPPVVMLIPLFLLMVWLGRVSHFDSVILTYAGLMFPFSVYLLVSYFETIPKELFEAAVVDGASHFRMLVSIVVPLSLPALVTLATVNALWTWNELLIAVVMLQDPDSMTLQAGIALLKGKTTTNVPLIMAGATVSALPMLLFYLVGQGHFRRGLVAGAVKE